MLLIVNKLKMKARVELKGGFEPIEVKLLIETEEEFLNMYSRMFLSKCCIKNNDGWTEHMNDDVNKFCELLERVRSVKNISL